MASIVASISRGSIMRLSPSAANRNNTSAGITQKIAIKWLKAASTVKAPKIAEHPPPRGALRLARQSATGERGKRRRRAGDHRHGQSISAGFLRIIDQGGRDRDQPRGDQPGCSRIELPAEPIGQRDRRHARHERNHPPRRRPRALGNQRFFQPVE